MFYFGIITDPENDLNYYDIPVDINTLDEKQSDQLDNSHSIDDSVIEYLFVTITDLLWTLSHQN